MLKSYSNGTIFERQFTGELLKNLEVLLVQAAAARSRQRFKNQLDQYHNQLAL